SVVNSAAAQAAHELRENRQGRSQAPAAPAGVAANAEFLHEIQASILAIAAEAGARNDVIVKGRIGCKPGLAPVFDAQNVAVVQHGKPVREALRKKSLDTGDVRHPDDQQAARLQPSDEVVQGAMCASYVLQHERAVDDIETFGR